jgi:hypothetical protein
LLPLAPAIEPKRLGALKGCSRSRTIFDEPCVEIIEAMEGAYDEEE